MDNLWICFAENIKNDDCQGTQCSFGLLNRNGVCFSRWLQCHQNAHILMKIVPDVIREYTVFMSCLFLVAIAWLHQIVEACFSFILLSEMFVEVENLTKLCEIVGISAIFVFLSFSLCYDQFPILLQWTWQWSSSMPVWAHSCSMYSSIETQLSRITLSRTKQNNFCNVFRGMAGLDCTHGARMDVSGFDQ